MPEKTDSGDFSNAEFPALVAALCLLAVCCCCGFIFYCKRKKRKEKEKKSKRVSMMLPSSSAEAALAESGVELIEQISLSVVDASSTSNAIGTDIKFMTL